MKIGEFHTLSDNELDKKLEALKSELFHLRVNLRTGQLENTNKIRETRRDLARANMVLADRRKQAHKEARS